MLSVECVDIERALFRKFRLWFKELNVVTCLILVQIYLLVVPGLYYLVLILFTKNEKPNKEEKAKETALKLKSGDSLLVLLNSWTCKNFLSSDSLPVVLLKKYHLPP